MRFSVSRPFRDKHHWRAFVRRLAGLGVVALALAGCSSAPPQTFDLSAANVDPPARHARRQVVVNEPLASAALDSERIVVRPHAEQIAYLTGAQWADRLPRLVQSRLIQTLENAQVLGPIGRPGSGLAADIALQSEIRAFDVDVEHHVANVQIGVTLVSPQSGRVIAANVFSAEVPVASATGAVASTALDAALGDVLRQIVAWTVAKI